MSAEDYPHLACPNPDCPAYGPSRSNPTRLGPLWEKKDKQCDPEDAADAEHGWDYDSVRH
jgi:hypothetical protein